MIEKKKKINQTPSNCQSQIQSWMCWFEDQYENHSLQIFVQSLTTEDGDVSTQNWKLLTVFFQVMKGEIVTWRKIVETSMQRRQNAIISKPHRDWEKITENTKPMGRLLGPYLWFRLTVILGWYVLVYGTNVGHTVRDPARLFIGL